jgi:hypothetical protein
MNALMTIETLGKPAMALAIPKKQTFDQWVEMGRELADGQKVINWWVGDWWAAGTHRYGERAKVAAEGIFGREFQTIANVASVCRSFETSRRREALTFSHHAEVAALPPKEADGLLDRAEHEGLSRRDLRIEAMKRKVALGLFKPRDQGEPDPAYDELMEGVRWWNRAKPETRIEFLDLANEAGGGVIRA